MRFRLSLKHKLILIVCLLLLTPFWALDYVDRLDNFLKQNLEQNLLLASQSLATGLHQRKDLELDIISSQSPSMMAGASADTWMVLPLRDPQLDGYDHEWRAYQDYRYEYTSNDADFSLQVYAGKHRGFLQFLLIVQDPQMNNFGLVNDIDRFDNVIIKVTKEELVSYFIVMSSGVGLATVKALDSKGNILDSQVSFIDAAWLETEQGYQMELRLSAEYRHIGFVVTDAGTRGRARRIRTSDSGVNRLRTPSNAVLDFFDSLKELGGRRVWLLDKDGGVIVTRGQIVYRTDVSVYNPFLGWFANTEVTDTVDPRLGKTRLISPEVKSALSGEKNSHWFTEENNPVSLVSAAHPIYFGDEIVGAIVVDESSTQILGAQRSTFLNLINIAGVVFILVTLSLIYFSGRVTFRLSQLQRFIDTVAENDGQMVAKKIAEAGRDEIGDLTRSFAAMATRVNTYQDYLRKLASRLSHEIRTPLAVVRSSLENLSLQSPSQEQQESIERAEQGIERLTKILTRMREATAVEDSIKKASMVSIDAEEFFKGLILGYRAVYAHIELNLNLNHRIPEKLSVAADLLAQALDKLIANAVDYSSDKKIDINVEVSEDSEEELLIRVTNRGPLIDPAVQETIFDSMVSLRGANQKHASAAEPHLGLGLYVVRLVAEFHRGRVEVRNLPSNDGVQFTVAVPQIKADSGDSKNPK